MSARLSASISAYDALVRQMLRIDIDKSSRFRD